MNANGVARFSVLEYLHNLQYKEKLNYLPHTLCEEQVDIKIELFALKLVNSNQVKKFYFKNADVFKKALSTGNINYKLTKIYFKPTYKKATFEYSSYEILNLLSILRQAYFKGEVVFKEFIRIPEIYTMLLNLYDSDIFFYNYINLKGLPIEKKEIVEILKILGLISYKYNDKFYLVDDCALIYYGIKEEVDYINICVDLDIFKMLQKRFEMIKLNNENYRIGNIIYISVCNKENFKCQKNNFFLVENLDYILKRKENELLECTKAEKVKILKNEIKEIRQIMKKCN